MTPKMTVKVTPKMTPKRQRMILKVKEMTQEAKDDTKNVTFIDDLQQVNNDAMNTHDTKNDTKNNTKN